MLYACLFFLNAVQLYTAPLKPDLQNTHFMGYVTRNGFPLRDTTRIPQRLTRAII